MFFALCRDGRRNDDEAELEGVNEKCSVATVHSFFFGERRLGTDLANVEEETSCGVVEERSKSDPGSVEESSL